jgi:hypothetical protein
MSAFCNSLDSIARETHGLSRTPHWTRSEPGNLEVVQSEEQTFSDPNVLQGFASDLIREAGPSASGWVLWSEKLQVLAGENRALESGQGWLLAADLFIPDARGGRAVAIRQEGGFWRAQSWRRVDSFTDPELDLPASFLEVRSLLPFPQIAALAGLRLNYEIAWQLAGGSTRTYRPAASRFIGFTSP